MIWVSRAVLCGTVIVGSACLSSVSAKAPANVGLAIQDAIAYHDTGTYQRDFDKELHDAQAVLKKERVQVKKPAIVLDIDETTLSNWPEMKANGLGYIPAGSCDHLPSGPCGDTAWMERAEAPAFAETRTLIDQAQTSHVAVFFITGRSEKYRQVMERNLHKEGISAWAHLYMRAAGDVRPAAAYKTPIRASIEQQGYTILVNIGDQESDLKGGHARHRYRVPNPFYIVP